MDAFVVDWQRRRVLQSAVAYPTHCHHGSKLIEWCGDCAVELDVLAADMLPKDDAA